MFHRALTWSSSQGNYWHSKQLWCGLAWGITFCMLESVAFNMLLKNHISSTLINSVGLIFTNFHDFDTGWVGTAFSATMQAQVVLRSSVVKSPLSIGTGFGFLTNSFQAQLYQYATAAGISTGPQFTFCLGRTFLLEDLKHGSIGLALPPSSFHCHVHLCMVMVYVHSLEWTGYQNPPLHLVYVRYLSCCLFISGRLVRFLLSTLMLYETDIVFNSYGPYASSALAGQSLVLGHKFHLNCHPKWNWTHRQHRWPVVSALYEGNVQNPRVQVG